MQLALPRAKVNHDTGFTGLVAVICMLIDHAGVMFFPGAQWMRVVGRIAFPLFAWGIAIGAEHTKNMPRYALRLFIMMLISQPFYMFALNHSLLKFNIFMTLLLGLLGIWGIKDRREWMTVIALMLAHLLSPDYGLKGVFCILILWSARNNPLALSICFCCYCVIWGDGYRTLVNGNGFTIRLQTTAVLALPFMLYPRAKRTPTPRWLMYAVYPGHLALYWIIKQFIAT